MFTSRRTHIANLYEEILDRPADTDGLNHYHDSNYTIDEIKTILLNSAEFWEKFSKNVNGPLVKCPVASVAGFDNTYLFNITDSEENYKQQCNILGPSWIYYNKPVDYKLNSLGYRMKEFNQVDWSNYMAVFGCSITFGEGLALEDTFSYRISQSLNLDLVNAGVCGTGNEVILMNLTRILSSANLPKLIIINWSHISRKNYWVYGNIIKHQIGFDAHSPWKKSYDCYVENMPQWRFEFLELKRKVETLCKLAQVPLWQLTNFEGLDFAPDITKILFNCEFRPGDLDTISNHFARDYGSGYHPGLHCQDLIIEQWYNIKHNLGF